MFSAFKYGWLPLVAVAVIVLSGYAVFQLHDVFGSQNINTATETKDDSRNTMPKDVVYEIFGPSSTRGQVNYLDERTQPQREYFTALPWRFVITTTLPSVFASVVAQGDKDSIGCRIIVDGVIRDEQTAHNRDAQTFCLVKAA
ncbi:MmpS family transport accessory protein [Mycobacterium shigaense]|uniref:Putative conserved membrane protein, MmpS n=1 Tax=Mycobacterium shigaense TaxID=722731 RepID=A0A1Z4EBW6_9MYCO|nr:MmpS family transport accessory protein [Mycobacterium shigaense]MEA1124195.1 MmpS family transport accessory protein [Mycobacterium shigaense]PRI17296.1 transporter [Mycobacterium shigaense]BAX90448.1 putative conserved membrane protein, MmpS [Mycobacterium shigaense]